jgi:hypothetical protein
MQYRGMRRKLRLSEAAIAFMALYIFRERLGLMQLDDFSRAAPAKNHPESIENL